MDSQVQIAGLVQSRNILEFKQDFVAPGVFALNARKTPRLFADNVLDDRIERQFRERCSNDVTSIA